MLGTLFSLPDAPTFLAAVGSTSSPILSDFIPYIELVIGFIVGLGILALLIKVTANAFSHHSS